MPIINQVVAGGGTTPTGTKSITANGSYDVTDFATADVNVPTTAPAHYIQKTVDANGKLKNSTNIINLNGVTDIGDYGLYGAYSGVIFPANTIADLSSLTAITGTYACARMFADSTITGVDLSSLTTISGGYSCNAMLSDTGITVLDLPSLTTISGGNYSNSLILFCNNCTRLITVKMNALNIINAMFSPFSYSETFSDCYRLETVEFGGLTASTFASSVNQMQYLFNSSTGSQAPNGCTVHFPSNFDPADPNHTFDASTLTGYPTFGGSASYIHVAFDLPASE